MPNSVPLNNVAHKDLRVKTGYAAEFGDCVNTMVVFPTEFAFVQREYPILFKKDADGNLHAVALLGLQKDENLFLDGSRWNARYVPAIRERGPFLIGVSRQDGANDSQQEARMLVDLDDARLSKTEGVPLFLKHGGNSPYLDHANRALHLLHAGTALEKPMFDAFTEAGLIEAMNIEIGIDESLTYQLADYFTISQSQLAELDGATLEALNRRNFLHLAMMVVTSLGNINWLVDLKNRKRAAG